ncbi:MFS transporter [Pleurocapsales cyanobacterium LEGE 06147]|nr:MFS transporter [Pleurocapsales cyanobacterium LEGE 06147]
MKAFVSLEPSTRRNLLTLFTAGLLFWFSMTSLLPVLPLYIQDIGGTKQQVGLVMGCFAIGLILSRTWLGQLADRRGRKIIILIGTTVAAIAPLGYLLVHSIPALMALRAFHGISIAAFTTGYSALVVDLSPVKQRGELIGYMSLAIPIGMAIGPALGGYIEANFGYTPLFLASASSGFLAWLSAWQVREELKTKTEIHLPDGDFQLQPNRNFRQLLKSPSLTIPAVIMLNIGLVFGTLVTFLPLYVSESELNTNAGLFYAVAAVASFIARAVVGRASDIFGRGLFITSSLICYAISMSLLALGTTPFVFLLAAVIEGTGAGILIPMMIALMSDRSHARERGKVYALCIGGFDLGIAIAGPILGSFAFVLSYSAMFFLAGGLASLGLFIFLTKSSKNLGHSLRFAFGKEKDVYAVG